ncbi:MAG TPA: BlaI/MecI/CopY family transcriptional regulator [Bryobacteraceae bacterium]|nr:BlaI/MecI/CopY family transcriptional regulator [Bryobacteraceae bacterium]
MPKIKQSEPDLSRRERQIMDILYSLGRATGPEVQERLTGAPSYSTVRTILRILERKGHVRHIEEGLRYIYEPAVERETAKKSAIHRLVSTFFDGSAKAAAAALLDPSASKLSDADLKELETMIRKYRDGRSK